MTRECQVNQYLEYNLWGGCYTKYCHHDYLQLVWVHHHPYCPPWEVSHLRSSCQALKKRESPLKINKSLVPHFPLLLPAVPHPMFVLPTDLPALYLKGWVRTPVKVKRVQVYLQKTYLWLILDDSRRILDVDGSLLGGSWIPILKELIPWWEELSLWRRNLSLWRWT